MTNDEILKILRIKDPKADIYSVHETPGFYYIQARPDEVSAPMTVLNKNTKEVKYLQPYMLPKIELKRMKLIYRKK